MNRTATGTFDGYLRGPPAATRTADWCYCRSTVTALQQHCWEQGDRWRPAHSHPHRTSSESGVVLQQRCNKETGRTQLTPALHLHSVSHRNSAAPGEIPATLGYWAAGRAGGGPPRITPRLTPGTQQANSHCRRPRNPPAPGGPSPPPGSSPPRAPAVARRECRPGRSPPSRGQRQEAARLTAVPAA